MITYALAVCAFGSFVTPAAAAALRESKFRNFELSFGTLVINDDRVDDSVRLTRQLIAEGVIRPASVHLPFGNNYWDPSLTDETARKDVAGRLVSLIRNHADLMAPMVTLHASGEPPMAEHPARLDQACRTIEDLLPAAEELGFVINVEFLPRTCIGNCAEELQEIVRRFDPGRVGICLDVNHIMDRYRELPDMIDLLAPRINSFHISDYDGVDETHWLPGQGLHDWGELLRRIRRIDHDVLLILETTWQLRKNGRPIDPRFAIRENEKACWFMENYDELTAQVNSFRLPGND
ncbi:MAG: sugar phosphate isomerase/epimerase [Lentisphaeria bacterium]|nr:sugar phosphate isomerase/epimerase [Lentisphaeria bacterium]